MFNLEEKISEWRRQMLAAGIKTPVPLEELEIHLREEIEQQTKSGLAAQQAFHAATEKIGQANALKTEFKKAGCQKNYMKKHTLTHGAIIGLVMGIVMAVASTSNWLPANSILFDIFYVIHLPMLIPVVWIQQTFHSSHGWAPDTNFYKWLAAYLCYWTSLGFLAELGWRALLNRKHETNAV